MIPALGESTSQRAIEILFVQIAVFEETTGTPVDEVAAFANRIRRPTNESDKMLTWLGRVFDDVPLYEVPERVALQYAYSEGVSVLEYDPDADVGDIFLEAADALASDVETTEAKAWATNPRMTRSSVPTGSEAVARAGGPGDPGRQGHPTHPRDQGRQGQPRCQGE